MRRKLNKKAFTLVEIVLAIAILAAASVGIGAIVVGVQNNSQKQFTQGDLQKQLSDVQDSLRNDLLTTNAGVKYWIQDDTATYVKSDGANKNPDRNKMVAMYTMDYIDNTLTKTYVKYDAEEDILYRAETSEQVVFDNSKKMLLDETPEEIAENTSLEWFVYAQGITNFSMNLSKYSENQTINYNVNINHEDSDFESDNTVNVRNEIPINEATVLENYDQAVVSRPALKNTSFQYNGQEQGPKQLDVNSRYVEVRLEDPVTDRLTATAVGTYRIIYHLKNATWDDGTRDDYIVEWEIRPREIDVTWSEPFVRVYDGQQQTASVSFSNVVPGEEVTHRIIYSSGNNYFGPDFCTVTATLDITNPNYTFKDAKDKQQEYSIVKGTASYTTMPQPNSTIEQPLVYNGSPQVLVRDGVAVGGTIVYSLAANGTYTENLPVATDANYETPYVVYYYIKGENNYADSEKQYMEVIIYRAEPTVEAPIPYDGENYILNYTGGAQGLLYHPGTTSANKLQYSLDGHTYASEIPVGVTASKYTIWYKSEANINYKESVPQYVEARILKTERPTNSFTIPTVSDLTYNGELQPLFKAGTGTATQAAGWMYRLDDTEWSTEIPQKDAAGDYPVYLKIPETADYAEYELPYPIIVTIKKAKAEFALGGVPSALPNLIYNGLPQNLIANGLTKDGLIYYGISSSTAPPAKEDMTLHIPQAVGAGTYNVFYYIKGDSNHEDSDVTGLGATINKARPIVTTSPVGLNAPYNGEEQILITLQGQSDCGFALQYSVDEGRTWGEAPPSKMSAGDYTVLYKVPASDNYTDSDIGMLVASINQAETRVSAPEALTGLVYNGSLQQLCKVGDTEFGTMEYSVDSKSQWSAQPPMGINAKTYSVYWRVAETSDYKGAEGKITVTISKQTLEVVAPTAPELVYTGEEQMLLDPTTGVAPAGYHFEYRFEDPAASWSKDVPTAIEAGAYAVEYRIVADNDSVGDNIDSSNMRTTVIILPATPTVIVKGYEDLVYNGQEQYLIDVDSSSTTLGSLEYCLEQGDSYSSNIPRVRDAGTYTVYWRTAASNNLVQQKGSLLVTVDTLIVDYPTAESVQIQYTGSALFPDFIMDEDNVYILSGNPEIYVNESGYSVLFDLTYGGNTVWPNGTSEPYEMLWYVIKGDTMPITLPTAEPKTFTGYEQDIIVPAIVDETAGQIWYRLAAFKSASSSSWTTFNETDQPWEVFLPKGTAIGTYKIQYKVESVNYEDIPVTEIETQISKGRFAVSVYDLEFEYDGTPHKPYLAVNPIGNLDLLTPDDYITDADDNEIIVQQRVVIEVSADNGKTWKNYSIPADPNSYDSTYYAGATDMGDYTIQFRVKDTLGEYESYTSSCEISIKPGRALWTFLPKDAAPVYNKSAQPLLTLPNDPDRIGMHFEYQVTTATESETGELVPDDSWSSQSATIPSKTNAGIYAIRIWAVADKNYKIYNEDGTTVDKKEIAIVKATIQKATIKLASKPTIESTFMYQPSSAQTVGLKKGTMDGTHGSAYFVYQVTYYETPTSDPKVYIAGMGNTAKNKDENNEKAYYLDSELTNKHPKLKDAGTYKISWWIKGDSNYEDYYHYTNGVPDSTFTVTIVKPDDAKAVTALNVPYTGQEQQIFILPSSVYLSLDGTTGWTNKAADKRAMTYKTEEGEYTLYWKASSSGAVQGPITATIKRGTLRLSEVQYVLTHNDIHTVVFTTTVDVQTAPPNAIDMSVERNKSILAWGTDGMLYVASAEPGAKILAPEDCSGMFANLPASVTSIDVSGIDTSNTTNMSQMFKGFGKDATGADVQILGLSGWNLSKVQKATEMFAEVGMNANTVYVPGLNGMTFPAGATTTNWRYNLGKNATQVEAG